MKKSVLLFFLTLGILNTFKCLVRAGCIHTPDAETTKEQLRNEAFQNYLRGDWTYNVIEEYRENTRSNRSSNLIGIDPRITKISGQSSCRKNRRVNQDSGVSLTATCPWYVVLDVDYQRQPQNIAKAKCSCKKCLTVDRTGNSRRDRCTEVNSFIPVVKWRCRSNYSGKGPNYFEYFRDIETVPVGCTCRRPGVLSNNLSA